MSSNAHRRGGWLITYSDMITLLMGFFVCLITLSARPPAGGAGRDSVLWRPRLRPARGAEPELAPLYQDPSAQTTERILQALDEADAAGREHNFAVRLPRDLLDDGGERLSASAERVLRALAANLRELPYDLRFQTARPQDAALAVRLCTFLASEEGFEPARLAVGGRPPAGGDGVWLVLVRQF